MRWDTRVSFISAMKVISFGILTQQQPQSLQCIQSLTLSSTTNDNYYFVVWYVRVNDHHHHILRIHECTRVAYCDYIIAIINKCHIHIWSEREWVSELWVKWYHYNFSAGCKLHECWDNNNNSCDQVWIVEKTLLFGITLIDILWL